ncbi:hypothetical protein BH24ACI2_BH24ACI2_10010 [soil metagenome]|jgi:tetratricopeptide (TPR) repeat protein
MSTKFLFSKATFGSIFLTMLLVCNSWQTVQAQSKPFTLGDVLTGLQSKSNEMATAQKNEFITKRIQELGVSFLLTPEIETELRNAAASPELIAAIKNAKKGKESAAGTNYELGLAYGKKGQYDLAITEYNKAIELDPFYVSAYHSRGIAYNKKKEYDLAITDYNKAILLDANYARIYVNRGLAYNNKNQHDQAIVDYNKAIELNPNFAIAYFSRGYAYHNKKQYDKAITDYTKAIELNPQDAFAYFNRGFSYHSKADYDRAIADYRKALEINPNIEYAKINLERLLELKQQKQ